MIKKYHNGTWTEIPYRKYGTETDTLTTLPAEVIADGNNATVGLVGNMAQTGTPSPQNPIEPSETGERTGNLFDITAFVQGIVPNRCTVDYDSVTNTLTINSTGSDAHTGNNNAYHIPVGGGETISLSWDTNSYYGDVYIFENGLTDSAHLHMWNSSLKRCTLTLRSDTTFIIIRVGVVSANISKTYSNIMLNTGTEPLPYEPYGIKIPILSGGTTTNVYMGEVQSTRRIYKYEITGNETFTQSSNPSYYIVTLPEIPLLRNELYSTHFIAGASVGDIAERACRFAGSETEPDNRLIFNYDSGAGGISSFQSWIAQQYANGTPVCVWYVLATPTTGIVNEPIRKIGDYADTVSGITVPTLGTSEQFDVDTTLKPSEVTVNYKGWHPVADAHKAGRTINIYDKYNTVDIQALGTRYGIYCNIGTYSIYNNTDNIVYWGAKDFDQRHEACQPHSTATVTMYGQERGGFFMPYNDGSLGEVTIVQGTTVPDHYIPYIDWD